MQATDAAGHVGPMSLPLTVVLDTAPPAPIGPVLRTADDTGVAGDNTTNIVQPTFVGDDAEPFALVQIFAQAVAAPGQPDNPIVLAGEALADAAGNYAVTVGQYVLPTPPATIPSLADGVYTITSLQLDVAGNISRALVFGNAGAVVIDGTDSNDHGFFSGGANQTGWFYMQQVLENIQPNVTNGNRLLLSVGADPALAFGGQRQQAAEAIASSFRLSTLPGLGWTIAFVEGATDIDTLLDGGIANAFDQNNAAITVRLSQVGILYFTTSSNSFEDLTAQELAVVNAHGVDIANYVNGGGGLFAQAESPFSFQTVVEPFGWLTSIFPNVVTTDIGGGGTGVFDVQITPAGMTAFPNLMVTDLSFGPWHNYFGSTVAGPDGVVGTADDDFAPLAPAVTDVDQFTGGVRRNLILTSAGGQTTTGLRITIDSTLPATPTVPDLQDASDSFFNVTDAAGAHVVGSNTDDYTNRAGRQIPSNPDAATPPSFAVGGVEGGTIITLFRDATLVGTPVTVPVGTGGLQTITLTDPGPVPDGVHSYQVRLVDIAGNFSSFTGPLLVRFDTSVPAVPTAPRLLPADDSGTQGDNLTNVARPRLIGSAVLATGEALPTVQLVDTGGTIVGEAVVAANGAYTVQLNVPVIPNSINFFTVRARVVDQAGNTSPAGASYTLTIDTRVPPTPTLALSPLDDSGLAGDNRTSVRQPNLVGGIGQTNQALLIDLQLVGPASTTTLVSGVRAAADGSFQIRFPAALADGIYQVRARVYDAAGNENFSPVLTLTIDTTAPAAVPSLILAPASDTGIRGDSRTSIRRPALVGTVGANPEPARGWRSSTPPATS